MATSVLLLLVVLQTGTVFQTVRGTSLKYQLTLHTKHANWNTANNVCKAHNSKLVQIPNNEKAEVIQYFRRHQWQHKIERDYWAGLFDDDIPNMRYTWTDCTLLGSSFLKWYPGRNEPEEPNDPNVQSYVAIRQADGYWATRSCILFYHFICEKTIGECTYSSLQNMKFSTNDDEVLQSRYNSIENCQKQCSADENTDTARCWAISYGNDQICVVHRSSSPFAIKLSEATSQAGYTASVRSCYTAAIDNSNSRNSLVDASSQPSLSCKEGPTTGSHVESSSLDANSTMGDITTDDFQPPDNSSALFTIRVFPSSSSDHTTWSLSESCIGANCPMISKQEVLSVSDTITSSEFLNSPEITTISDIITPTTITSETVITAPMTTSLMQFSTVSNAVLEGTNSNLAVPTGPVMEPTRSLCRCPCALSKNQSSSVIASILEDLTIETKSISSYKRKHTSAPDERPSAQRLGYLGVTFLVLVFGGILLLDIPTLYRDMKTMISNLKN